MQPSGVEGTTKGADGRGALARWLTPPGQILLAVDLLASAVAAAWWFRFSAFETSTLDMPVMFWTMPGIVLSLALFLFPAYALQRLGVTIFRADEERPGDSWRIVRAVLGGFGALFLLANLVMRWIEVR